MSDRPDPSGVEVDLDDRHVSAEGEGGSLLDEVHRPRSAGHRRSPRAGPGVPGSRALEGTPATATLPSSVTTMSAGLASSSSEANSLASANTSSVACRTTLPASCSDLDPPVPPPRGTVAVSDCTNPMSSRAMPRVSDTIMANDVAWPCPCPDVPTLMDAVPSACTSMAPNSGRHRR